MDLFIIIVVIVLSIWSEVNKHKKEKNLDFDFSELSSIDDFLKNKDPLSSPMPASQAMERKSRQRKNAQKSKSRKSSFGGAHNESEFKPLTGQVNYDRATLKADRADGANVNYDNLPSQSQQGSFEKPLFDNDGWPSREDQRPTIDIKFDKNSLIQALIMSEVLNRYDINSIYERVPGVRNDEE